MNGVKKVKFRPTLFTEVLLSLYYLLASYLPRISFIAGEGPEEPEDSTNANACGRIPEGEYQGNQVTGEA